MNWPLCVGWLNILAVTLNAAVVLTLFYFRWLGIGATSHVTRCPADNLGHTKGGLGLGLGLSMTSHYAGKEGLEAKGACVRAVKLPA
jgi:hypothetical protein